MRSIVLALVFVLLSLGVPSALAQDGSGIDAAGSTGGYSCWTCPVCGYIVQLQVPVGTNAQTYSTTLSQVTTLNPNDPSWYCPSCYYYYGGTLTFAGNFVLVPCQSTGYGQNTGYNQNAGSGQNTGYGQGSTQGQGLQSGFGQQSRLGQSNLGESTLSGAQTGDESENIEKLQGKVLMIVCPKDFQMTELDVPRNYFEKRGLEVAIASNESEAKSMDGEAIETDLTLSQVKTSDYSAIIFVGGDGIELQKVYEDPEFLAVAKKAGSSGMLIGAICLGPNIIANAGLLQGKKATGSDTDYLASKGADVVYDPVVRDGNIITGSGPDASQEFAEEVALAISESSQSTVLSQSTVPSTAQSTGDTSSENSTSASRLPFSGSLETSQPSGLTGSGRSSSEQSSSSDASAAQSSGLQETYICSICGYVYDPAEGDPEQGIAPGTPFENLPSSWKCPLCGAGKEEFSSDA